MRFQLIPPLRLAPCSPRCPPSPSYVIVRPGLSRCVRCLLVDIRSSIAVGRGPGHHVDRGVLCYWACLRSLAVLPDRACQVSGVTSPYCETWTCRKCSKHETSHQVPDVIVEHLATRLLDMGTSVLQLDEMLTDVTTSLQAAGTG